MWLVKIWQSASQLCKIPTCAKLECSPAEGLRCVFFPHQNIFKAGKAENCTRWRRELCPRVCRWNLHTLGLRNERELRMTLTQKAARLPHPPRRHVTRSTPLTPGCSCASAEPAGIRTAPSITSHSLQQMRLTGRSSETCGGDKYSPRQAQSAPIPIP